MTRSLPTKSNTFRRMLSVFVHPCMIFCLSEKKIDLVNKLIAYLARIVMKFTFSL